MGNCQAGGAAHWLANFALARAVEFDCIISTTVQPGSPSILGMELRSLSQSARLEQQICASGRMSIGLSSDPAGTTSKPTSGWEIGNADPQSEQKLFMWREPGRRNVLIFASPETQMSLAVEENRFAEWAEPLSLRQREQWHRKKLSNSPDMRNFTAPQRHCPVVGFLSIHTPRNRQPLPPAERISLFPCIRVLDPGQKELKESQPQRRKALRVTSMSAFETGNKICWHTANVYKPPMSTDTHGRSTFLRASQGPKPD